MKRTVTIDLRKLTDAPWAAGDPVTFRLRQGSFTAEATYPRSAVPVAVGDDGRASAELWCNSEGLAEAEYVCTLPSGEAFAFTLPPGEGDISAEALRAVSTVPYTQSSEAAFQGLVNAHAAGEAAARAAAESVYTTTLTEDAALDIGAALRALILIDATAGDVTATLQPAAEMANRELTFKKVAGDFMGVVDAGGSETIDGSQVFNLELVNQTVRVMAAGGVWYIV